MSFVREWLSSPGFVRGDVDHRDVLHFRRKRVLVRTDRQATLQNRNDPVESRRRNGRVKIVYLVCRDRRSPEQRQSYMREGALLRSSRAPILSLHHAVVGRRTAKSDAVSLVVGAHASEGAAPGDSTFEMIDMRRFEVCACRLIVAAILV